MIDCENEVYTRLARQLRAEYKTITITGEYINEPSAFPHVSIIMTDNSVSQRNIDGSGEYEAAIVTFEINIYSAKQSGRKAECKEIAKSIDREFNDMNFTRLAMTPVPNLENAGIYRIVARYSGICDGEKFYRR